MPRGGEPLMALICHSFTSTESLTNRQAVLFASRNLTRRASVFGCVLGENPRFFVEKASAAPLGFWGGQELSCVYHMAVEDTLEQPGGAHSGVLAKNDVKKMLVSQLQITSVLRSDTTHERA